MGYPEHPSWQELSAEKERVESLNLRVIEIEGKYSDLITYWTNFQQDLQVLLRDGYGESFTELAGSQIFAENHPRIHKWIVDIVQQEANQRKEQELIQYIKDAVAGLDDATLANMGLQRIK